MVATASLNDDRSSQRRDIYLAASLRVGGVPIDAEMIDLSSTGFCALVSTTLAEGTSVQISSPSIGSRAALLVWTEGRVHGFAFDVPLSPNLVAGAALVDTVVTPDFGPGRQALSRFSEPKVAKYSRATRFVICAGLVIGSWSLIIASTVAILH